MQKEQTDTSQLKLRHAMFFPKIVIMALTFFILGILPLFPVFRQWANIPNRIPMLWVIGVTWVVYVIYEFWFLRKWHRKESTKIVSHFEVATGAIALSFFIHYLGGINGPLFFLYFTHLFEASLALIITLPFVGASIMTPFIIGEFILFVNQGRIVLNVAEVSLLFLRISILFMVAYWATTLTRSILGERRVKVSLAEALEELKKLDKAKSEFVSIASHQLRTPLTAIKGYISMMLEKTYGEPPEKMERPLKNIYLSNERLIKLVNDLLNISRIEAGRMEMNPEKLQIEEIINSVVDELKNIVKEKNLYLKFEKLEKSLPKISVDKEKIRQAIMNVVDNAIRYTERGGVTIKCKMQNAKCKIEVKDTGTGLTKYELAKMFESFSRGVAGTRLYTEGVGLGLYVAKKFVEMHKGQIWAESKGKDKGSIFYIELPIK